MQLGMVGLGKMGANMVRRLMRAGHECVVFDLSPDAVQELVGEGATGASSLAEFAQKLAAPRAAWVMVPCGRPTDAVIAQLTAHFEEGDIVIDGGNSYFEDDLRHARELREHGIHFVDAGTSGGVWGLDEGYSLMIGGEDDIVGHLDPIFATLAPGVGDTPRTPGREGAPVQSENGYLHCGPVGSGHFVKMVHNGIEYGIMQAYAEGFDILRNATHLDLGGEKPYDLKLGEVAEVWRRGSVIRSWLLDLSAIALLRDPQLETFEGAVSDSGEGRWTVDIAIREAVPAPVITSALFARFRSRQQHTFGEKLLSAMRLGFGGHIEKKV
jgi:6-phosphogluconate dehydrogenase